MSSLTREVTQPTRHAEPHTALTARTWVAAQRKFLDLGGSAENQGDLRSVVLHKMSLASQKSSFPIGKKHALKPHTVLGFRQSKGVASATLKLFAALKGGELVAPRNWPNGTKREQFIVAWKHDSELLVLD